MSHADQTTPRLVYKGSADEHAETTTAQNADDLADKLKAGWRLTRVDKQHAAPAAKSAIKIPAQTVIVDPASAQASADGQVRADADAKAAAEHTATVAATTKAAGKKKR